MYISISCWLLEFRPLVILSLVARLWLSFFGVLNSAKEAVYVVGPRFKLKQNSIYVDSHFTLAQNYLKVRIVLSTSTNKKFC